MATKIYIYKERHIFGKRDEEQFLVENIDDIDRVDVKTLDELAETMINSFEELGRDEQYLFYFDNLPDHRPTVELQGETGWGKSNIWLYETLSTKEQDVLKEKLIDLYKLGKFNLNSDEAVQSVVNEIIEIEQLIKKRDYMKLILKD